MTIKIVITLFWIDKDGYSVTGVRKVYLTPDTFVFRTDF
jgi:hypothetical protein